MWDFALTKSTAFQTALGPVAARYIVATVCLTGSYACGGFTDFLKTLHACLTAFCMKTRVHDEFSFACDCAMWYPFGVKKPRSRHGNCY